MNHPIEQEFAAVVAALLAGRLDGAQANASMCAIHEGVVAAKQAEAWDEGMRYAQPPERVLLFSDNPYRADRTEARP